MNAGSYVNSKKQPILIRAINRFIYSPFCILLFGILTAIAFAYSKEIELYSAVILFAIYVALFCEDFSPFMPLFVLCYIAPSVKNNPGKSDEGLFYGNTGIYILLLAAAAVVILTVRIVKDHDMGLRRLFFKKRALLPGMLLLGVAYMLSGIGSENRVEYLKSNLLFAFVQFVSIFLLYFLFSATVKWNEKKVDYFAYSGLVMGFVVAFELLWIYKNGSVIVDGEIVRRNIYTGWGIYNNMGAIITMSIPFAFYFATKRKRCAVYLLLACVLLVSAFLTCSRSSILFALIVFAASFFFAYRKAECKWEFRLTSFVLLAAFCALCFLYGNYLSKAYGRVPDIAEIIDGALIFNDSNRFKIYKDGIDLFLKDPIFGRTFYHGDYNLYDFSEIESFSSFFPPRWHNTVIQLLVSTGIVGMAAYAWHRIETIALFIRRKSTNNLFIALSLLSLLGMSLLDCHFFNVGPVLFYSIALAVVEFGNENELKALN